MAETFAWYPKYPLDFRLKTQAYSLLVRGAYNELLDRYYETATPLPGSVEGVCRMVGCATDEERAAVVCALENFFVLGEDGMWHNGRADEEIAAQKARYVGRSQAAERARKAKENKAISGDQVRDQPTDQGYNHNNKEQRTKSKPKSVCGPSKPDHDGFENFWKAYPSPKQYPSRKAAKAQCHAKWLKLTDEERILALGALVTLKASREWLEDEGKFTPAPLVFFNQRRWDLDQSIAAGTPKHGDYNPNGDGSRWMEGLGWTK